MATVYGASPAGIASAIQAATGAFIADGQPFSLNAGFNPKEVEIVNETQNVTYRKLQGNAPATCLRSAAGARTVDTTGLVLFPADAGLHEPGSSVLCDASIAANGDAVAWIVKG